MAATTSAPTPAKPKIALKPVYITPVYRKPTVKEDVIEVDQTAHRLYVADRTDQGVDVLDVSTPTGTYLRTIHVESPPNGLAVAANMQKLAVGLTNSTVAIVDLAAGAQHDQVIADLNTGGKKRADTVSYDPKDKKFFAVNGDDGFVTVIDAVKDQIVSKITIGPGLELSTFDSADGMVYLSGSDKNVVFQIDPVKDVLAGTFPVGQACYPHGIAIDASTDQAMLNCGKQQYTVLWDVKTHKILKTFDQAGAGDMAIYDAKADRWFFGCNHYQSGSEVAVFGGSPVAFLLAVPTPKAADTSAVAYDETNHVVYTRNEGDGGLLSFVLPGD